jgi:nitronate monooxygenase
MWKKTALSNLLGIATPIVQGPFGGGLSSTALLAIVSNAGGLGSFGAQHLEPAQIGPLVDELKQLTSRPFAINLWVSEQDSAAIGFTRDDFDRHVARLQPFYDELGIQKAEYPIRFGQSFPEQVEALLAAAPPVFSFVFGIPDPTIVAACRSKGIVTIGTATTADEAEALEAGGVDAIVATGLEAGGHRVSFLRTPEQSLTGGLVLIQLVRARVQVPVVAAGGIVTGRGVAGAMMLGADGVQIGTAFLACEESAASDPHRQKLWSEEAQRTVLTRGFTGRLARSIPNRFAVAMEAFANDLAPYPIQRWLTGTLRAAALAQGRADLISLWAGQAAPLLQYHRAGELFSSLVRETDEAFAWAATQAPSPTDPATSRQAE